MKKVLLATTALLMTAGYASAEVGLSGDGRMGIVYNANGNEEVDYVSRLRTKFTLNSETDTGLAFGGSFRSKDAGNANDGSAGSVFVSGAFGRLEIGDVDGAAEAAVGDLYGVGLTGVGDFSDTIFISQGAEAGDPGALYSYSFDTFSMYVSGKDNNDNAMNSDRTVATYAVGATFEAQGFAFGIGYEDLNNDLGPDASAWAISAEGDVQGFGVKVVYGQISTSNDLDAEQYGISGKYDMNGTVVSAFWRQVTEDVTAVDTLTPTPGGIFTSYTYAEEGTFLGIGAEQDLGGGAKVVGGLSRNSDEDVRADLGLSFSF